MPACGLVASAPSSTTDDQCLKHDRQHRHPITLLNARCIPESPTALRTDNVAAPWIDPAAARNSRGSSRARTRGRACATGGCRCACREHRRRSHCFGWKGCTMRWKGNNQSQERGPSKGELHTVDSFWPPEARREPGAGGRSAVLMLFIPAFAARSPG